MDRDDVEHLFRNQAGFTFYDRKRFWLTIQKLVCGSGDGYRLGITKN